MSIFGWFNRKIEEPIIEEVKVEVGDVWELDGENYGNPFVDTMYKATITSVKGEWVQYSRSNGSIDSMHVPKFVAIYIKEETI